MTGPEHYREAERLLNVATDLPHADIAPKAVASAQVHATLALAAATALAGRYGDVSAWQDVAATIERERT